jgi:hypothetical protein
MFNDTLEHRDIVKRKVVPIALKLRAQADISRLRARSCRTLSTSYQQRRPAR